MHRIGTVVCPVIVGRDDLLELTDRRLGAVARGRGHLLFVAAEAGVGKTRMVGAMERRASSAGFGVTEGLTNREVAGELGLSPKTVSAHLEHIMAKLGVGRRAEVAAWVASTGVLHSRPHGEDREE